MFETEINKKKNIIPVQPKMFEDFDFEFSNQLQNLSDAIHNHCPKNGKVHNSFQLVHTSNTNFFTFFVLDDFWRILREPRFDVQAY